jgi:predicted nucleic acid-binding protein
MTGDGPVFVDTNVLLYWIDTAHLGKQQTSRAWVAALWESGIGRTSWQVLNEFYVNATRKLHAPAKDVQSIVEAYAQWHPAGFGLGLVRRAWEWADSTGVPYWDALILSAAEQTGCRYLLSEDFQHGRVYGSLRVINPFQTDPSSFVPHTPL